MKSHPQFCAHWFHLWHSTILNILVSAAQFMCKTSKPPHVRVLKGHHLYIFQLGLQCCDTILSFPSCMKPTLQRAQHINCIEQHIAAVIWRSLYFLFHYYSHLVHLKPCLHFPWSISWLLTDKTLSCVQQTSQVRSVILYKVPYNCKLNTNHFTGYFECIEKHCMNDMNKYSALLLRDPPAEAEHAEEESRENGQILRPHCSRCRGDQWGS